MVSITNVPTRDETLPAQEGEASQSLVDTPFRKLSKIIIYGDDYFAAMRRRTYLALAGSTVPAVAGCLGNDGGQEMSEEDVVETIDIKTSGFDPATVSIEPGEGVEWVNTDTAEHTVLATSYEDDAADWDFEQPLQPEESDFYVFHDAGIYDVSCGVHTQTFGCQTIFVGDHEVSEDRLPCK